MAKIVFLSLICLIACATAQRITTINLDGVQYFISRMNPYSPELNYFLAYQYCRSLGLQLASFETKEKSESIMLYLKNGGYSKYDFWTSGNRLGTDMFIWLSTGLPFNTTFDFFENSSDALQSGLLNPVDHNGNTSPQRTARDSSSGAQKDDCVILKKPNLEWMPEDCLAVKDFICEQTRCYYYNYGSIPVSPSQGRPITTTTKRASAAITFLSSTTPLPSITSTYASFGKRNQPESAPEPSFASLKLDHERALEAEQDDDSKNVDDKSVDVAEHHVISNDENDGASVDAVGDDNVDEHNHELNQVKKQIIKLAKEEIEREHDENFLREDTDDHQQQQQQHHHENDKKFAEHEKEIEIDGIEDNGNIHLDDISSGGDDDNSDGTNGEGQENAEIPSPFITDTGMKTVSNSDISDDDLVNTSAGQQNSLKTNDIPSVEMRLKQISQEIEKIASGDSHLNNGNNNNNNNNDADGDDLGRQSFLSLTDLIRTLRPNDKQIPQIDSDYSNAMRVLGETSSLVGK